MKKNIGTLILIVLSFVVGASVMHFYNTSPRPSKIKVKDRETLSQTFSSGCEVGVMKNCDPKKMKECRDFCILFVDTNPKVIDLLLEGLEKNVP